MMHRAWCCLSFLKVIRQISRSRLKKSSLLTQTWLFQTVTPVWIHQWLRNVTQSLHRRGALLFCCFSRSSFKISRSNMTRRSPILTRIERFPTATQFWIHRWLWNDAQNLWYKRGAILFFKVIRLISRWGWVCLGRRPGACMGSWYLGYCVGYRCLWMCLVSAGTGLHMLKWGV